MIVSETMCYVTVVTEFLVGTGNLLVMGQSAQRRQQSRALQSKSDSWRKKSIQTGAGVRANSTVKTNVDNLFESNMVRELWMDRVRLEQDLMGDTNSLGRKGQTPEGTWPGSPLIIRLLGTDVRSLF